MTTQKINELIQEIVTNSELMSDFYEVEVSVLIRKDGGAKSDFIRAQSQWTPERVKASEGSDSDNNPFKWM
ncbi:MAG: hypothetical protein AWU57_2197 [Marinobacter sp. T13-3]|jgi:hypothetical protein|nr:MAG: hypothetical protein AWU57_2197 [Marinobacter sp. T13-3]